LSSSAEPLAVSSQEAQSKDLRFAFSCLFASSRTPASLYCRYAPDIDPHFDDPALDNPASLNCPIRGASPRIKIFPASKTTKPAPFLTFHHAKNHPITTFLQLRTTISPSATILFLD
jgi:hypothetical protein